RLIKERITTNFFNNLIELKPIPTTCSPHINFTTNGFFNPHLAPPDSGYDFGAGPFVSLITKLASILIINMGLSKFVEFLGCWA
ncbi:hypothetical protein VP01_15329g1, partial [Puccinia sorghi]